MRHGVDLQIAFPAMTGTGRNPDEHEYRFAPCAQLNSGGLGLLATGIKSP